MLISPQYKAGNRSVHANQPMWGASAPRWLAHVLAHAAKTGSRSILDYGSGKGHLALHLRPLGFDVREYDPGIPGKDGPPEPADMVACLDVLEHVEPEYLDNVLRDIDRLGTKGAFLAIALYPSGTIMPDGRNSHLIVEAPEWWADRLRAVWPVFESQVIPRPSRNPKRKDVMQVGITK